MIQRSLALVLATTLLAPCAFSQAKRDLRLKGKVGDTYAYKLSSTIAPLGAEGKLDFGATFTEKLTKAADGELHWLTSFVVTRATGTGVMKGGEAGIRQLDGLQLTSVQNAKAEVLRLMLAGNSVASRGSANVTLPAKAVAIGETWKSHIEVSQQLIPITYKLAKYEKMGGKTVARIDGSFAKDSIAKASKPTRFWVDVANGKMVRGEADTVVTTQGMQIRVTYLVERTK